MLAQITDCHLFTDLSDQALNRFGAFNNFSPALDQDTRPGGGIKRARDGYPRAAPDMFDKIDRSRGITHITSPS